MLDKLMKLLKVHLSSSLTLKDGTPLQLEGDLETGVKISVVTSDGNIALPDGEYQMEDMTIITCKDGLVMDIIKPGEVEEETGGDNLNPPTETESNDLATQKGNPEVSGEDPQPTETTDSPLTGSTTAEAPVEAAEMPETEIEEPEVEIEEPVDPMEKIAELEAKIAAMEEMMKGMMDKMNMNEEKTNMIAEKFSAAQPLIIKKHDNTVTMDPRLQGKVDLIKSLRKSGS